jgi:hypothetical protein
MIAGGLRLGGARRIAQMMRELTAQGALDQRLFEPPHRRLDLPGGQRTVPDELIENLRRHRGQRRGRRGSSFSGHIDSSFNMPHTQNS